jgi:Flp pilus assembly pilin Flp
VRVGGKSARRSTRRVRDERGNAMVEFALVAPLLVVMLFGIIDFGNVYNQLQSLRQGVQEGARVGVVPAQSGAPWGTNTSCGLTGLSPSTNTDTQALMCTVKADIGAGNAARVDIIYAASPGCTPISTACFEGTWTAPSSSQQVGGVLVVCAAIPLSSISGLFAPLLNGKFMTSKAEYAIEQPLPSGRPSGSDAQGYETDPTGQNWSWCTP